LNNTTKQYTEDLGLALVADDDIKKEETIEFHIGKAILESEFKNLKKKENQSIPLKLINSMCITMGATCIVEHHMQMIQEMYNIKKHTPKQ
jgi:hypothetical protein